MADSVGEITVNTEKVLSALKLLNPKISSTLIEAVNIGGQMIATQARDNLRRTDTGGEGVGGAHVQTGHLLQSTVPKEAKTTPEGIEGGTKATMEYAIHEEARHPFLFPALVQMSNAVQMK